MVDDPKVLTPGAAAAVLMMPDAITLNADYAWFTAASKSSPSMFVQRSAGETITDAAEIAYLASINANFSAA